MALLPALIIANHGLGLLLWRTFTSEEVAINAAMIKQDGANDTLKDGFHERRTWHRAWVGLLCTGIGSVPVVALAREWELLWWSCPALLVLLAGYFLRTFSPMLNATLGVAYKARFYVSYSATASLLDRFVWWLAGTKLVLRFSEGVTDRQLRANALFQTLLNVCLVLTLVVYTLLVVPLFRLA